MISNLVFLFSDSVSVSITNLYPGCENVSVRSRSMMFEPGLTKGVLEAFVSPAHHSHFSADDQSTKAIDIQNAYLNGKQSSELACITSVEKVMLLVFRSKK